MTTTHTPVRCMKVGLGVFNYVLSPICSLHLYKDRSVSFVRLLNWKRMRITCCPQSGMRLLVHLTILGHELFEDCCVLCLCWS